MRISYLAYAFSLAMMYFSIFLLIPIIVAIIYQETNAILPFLIASASSLMIGVTLRKIFKGTNQIKTINDIKKGEGLFVVTFCWFFAGLLTMIP